jgi:hypothetical protein
LDNKLLSSETSLHSDVQSLREASVLTCPSSSIATFPGDSSCDDHACSRQDTLEVSDHRASSSDVSELCSGRALGSGHSHASQDLHSGNSSDRQTSQGTRVPRERPPPPPQPTLAQVLLGLPTPSRQRVPPEARSGMPSEPRKVPPPPPAAAPPLVW